MRVASALCRQQEAIQREIAETSTLENRRKIATAAADAWAKEAILADKREAGQLDPRDKLDNEIAQEFALEDLEMEEASEHATDQPDAS